MIETRETRRALNLASIENDLTQVAAVLAARLVADGDSGEIDEIHILASPERKAKQIIRDIESLLFVKHRYRLDYRKISLVQLDPGQVAVRRKRCRLDEVAVRTNNSHHGINVEVHLTHPARGTVIGRAEGSAEGDVAYIAGLAVINGLKALFEDVENVTEVSSATVALGTRACQVVSMTLNLPSREELLLGAAFVHGDDDRSRAEAGAKALLDAVNRRFFER